MKTTLKEQAQAVKTVLNHRTNITNQTRERLNDACSTLAALNLIGQDVVLIAPELITVVRKLIARFEGCGSACGLDNTINDLKKIIKRLK